MKSAQISTFVLAYLDRIGIMILGGLRIHLWLRKFTVRWMQIKSVCLITFGQIGMKILPILWVFEEATVFAFN
jgi:hypothetical protein